MKRHHKRPSVEGLESRSLMSLVVPLPMARPVHVASSGGSIGGSANGPGLAQGAGPSGTISDNMNPPANAREAAKQRFHAVFATNVYTLPPRFTDEAKQYRLNGPGTTSYFLHGTLNLQLLTPKDPASETVVGAASVQDKSIGTSGILLLNITGEDQILDARGRPTHLNFNVNGGGGSGGIFASAQGTGTLDIHYKGLRAMVVFNGKVITTGVGNPLSVFTLARLPKRVPGP